jgi:hypothetical protein
MYTQRSKIEAEAEAEVEADLLGSADGLTYQLILCFVCACYEERRWR